MLSSSSKKSERAHAKMLQDPNFISLLDECERQAALDNPHPKMEKLLSILLTHFANAESPDNNEEPDPASESKVMIFVQYRQGVDEILRHLKPHRAMLKPSRFVGQSSDKKGEKGMSQKEQLDVSFLYFITLRLIDQIHRLFKGSSPENSIYLWQQLSVKKAWISVRLIESFAMRPRRTLYAW